MCQKLIALTLSTLALAHPAPPDVALTILETAPEYELPAPAPAPLPTELPTPVPLPPTVVPTPTPPPTVRQIITRAALWWGLDPAYLLRVAWCESSHRPWVTSPAGHMGLYQFSRTTWSEQAPRFGISGHFSAAYDAWNNAYLAAALLADGQHWRWSCA